MTEIYKGREVYPWPDTVVTPLLFPAGLGMGFRFRKRLRIIALLFCTLAGWITPQERTAVTIPPN
jgi:hypothetical protein